MVDGHRHRSPKGRTQALEAHSGEWGADSAQSLGAGRSFRSAPGIAWSEYQGALL